MLEQEPDRQRAPRGCSGGVSSIAGASESRCSHDGPARRCRPEPAPIRHGCSPMATGLDECGGHPISSRLWDESAGGNLARFLSPRLRIGNRPLSHPSSITSRRHRSCAVFPEGSAPGRCRCMERDPWLAPGMRIASLLRSGQLWRCGGQQVSVTPGPVAARPTGWWIQAENPGVTQVLSGRRGCPCATDRIDCYRTTWDDGCPRLYRLSYRHSRSVMDGRNSSLQIAVGPARDPGWRVQGRWLSRRWLGLRADPQPD